MLGLKFTYKNNKGQTIDIEDGYPQYLYLEPKGKVVVRYFFIKDGIETSNTKLITDVKEIDVVSVKVKKPASVFLSTIADFRNIPDRTESGDYFEIDFSEGDSVPMDILYESKVEERLKIKVKNLAAEDDSFENENTVTDGPDAYVKVVGIIIRPQEVYYVHIFRRSGRLRKAPGSVEYERLSRILKTRMFTNNVDKDLSYDSILRGLSKDVWSIDYSDKKIFKNTNGKDVEITDYELGQLIRNHGDIKDIINLVTTTDITMSNHPLVLESAMTLISCDGDCSLPKAIPQNTIDERVR